jgi:hypothetical protein
MSDNFMTQDYVKAEMDYRRDRIRGQLALSRRRRAITRRAAVGESTFGTVR